jgi:hypothetical protein
MENNSSKIRGVTRTFSMPQEYVDKLQALAHRYSLEQGIEVQYGDLIRMAISHTFGFASANTTATKLLTDIAKLKNLNMAEYGKQCREQQDAKLQAMYAEQRKHRKQQENSITAQLWRKQNQNKGDK